MIREQADMEETGTAAFVDDPELLRMINASIGIWHGMLVEAMPERFEVSASFTGAASVALPANYYITLGVDFQESASRYVTLHRVLYQERNRFETTSASPAVAYYVSASSLFLLPAPTGGTYRHSYISHAPELVVGADTIDGVNGWEQWIVYDVAMKMREKEESNVTNLSREKDKIQTEIEQAAHDRIIGSPHRVIDTREFRSWEINSNRYDPDFWNR
jgi:hypothetical protein